MVTGGVPLDPCECSEIAAKSLAESQLGYGMAWPLAFPAVEVVNGDGHTATPRYHPERQPGDLASWKAP